MSSWSLLADVVLVLHALFVAFVVFGQLLVLAGMWRQWSWVRDARFRLAHLAAIGIVVVQAWAGVPCPLTTLESLLRERAGEAGYAGSFVAWWLHRLIFFDAPPWLFTLAYSAFAALVAATWHWCRPRPLRWNGRA